MHTLNEEVHELASQKKCARLQFGALFLMLSGTIDILFCLLNLVDDNILLDKYTKFDDGGVTARMCSR